ncbi:PAS domain S-box protein [Thermodesulfobacteriota bacterium]
MAKKPTYEELEQEVNLLRLVCDNIPDLIWSKDLEGRFLFVNQAMCDKLIMCDNPDKALGKTNMFFADQQRNSGYEHTFGETCVDSDSIIRGKKVCGRFLEDGLVRNKYLVLDVHKAPFLNKDGEMIGTIGCGRDVTKEKETEKALWKSEEKYRSLVESSDDSIYLVAEDLTYLFMNGRHLSQYGGETEKVIGRNYAEFHFENEIRDFANRVQTVFDTGRSLSYEYQSERNGGYYLRSLSPVKDSGGETKAVTVVSRDVTERKRAEEVIRESEEKYRDLFNNAEVGMFRTRLDGSEILDLNDKFLDICGRTREEVLGLPSVIHWADPSEREEIVCRLELEGHVLDFECKMLNKQGEVRTCLTSLVLYREQGILEGSIIDITERKQAEETLRENEALKNTIIESSPDCIKLLDLGGNLTYMSKGGQEKLEIKDIKVYLNKSWIDYWEGKDNIKARMAVDTAVKGSIGKFRGYSPTETGIPRWWDVIIAPLWGSNGEVEQLLAVSRDITEQKQVEDSLLKAQKLESVGLLAGGIAHDFNNILTTILGNVSMAKTQMAPEDEIFGLLKEAETASIQAQALTKQLLTFAKGGAPVKETASIKDILKESCSFVQRGSKSRSELSIARDIWPVEVDVGQISQVINNIVINANQAMPNGGTIQVAAENVIIEDRHGLPINPERYIRISIKDQGVGIAEKHLLNIFDPYFTTKHEGSGLGLTTTYSIIKKHDGHITVESQLGVGTTFHIYLPASDKAIPEKEEVRLITGQGRILVMDDEASLRKMVGRMLGNLGYESEFAENGAEAIEMYNAAQESEKPYDAVILDLTIPGGMGGKETINKLLEIDPEVKAIVSSGYSDDPVLTNFKEYGFKGMMPKPFESLSLSKVLHEVLKGEKG